MLQITLRAWGLTLLVGALGALLGFGLELVLGQAGWAVIGASIGLCGGAAFAASLMNPPETSSATAVATMPAESPPAASSE